MNMKNIHIGPIVKLLMGIAAAILLTFAAYYGIINIGLSIVPRELWHREIQNVALSLDAQEMLDYAELLNMDEKERKEVHNKLIEQYRERFDPANTNLRYTIKVGDKVLESTLEEGQATMAETLRGRNNFIGTDAQLRQIEVYEEWNYRGYYYDPNTQTTYSRQHIEDMMRGYDEEGVEYDNSVNPTPSPMPVDTADVVVTTPRPTPNATQDVDVVEITPSPKPQNVIVPNVISTEQYNTLQRECYEDVDVAMYVVDSDSMEVDDLYHQVYIFGENIIIDARDNYNTALLCGCIGVLLVLVLLVTAGKRDEEGNALADGTGTLPWDVWLVGWSCIAVAVGAGVAFGVAIPANILFEGVSYYDHNIASVQYLHSFEALELILKMAVVGGFACIALLVGTLHSIAARVKVKGWWKHCLTAKAAVWCWKWCLRIIRWCWKLCKGIWGSITGMVKAVPMIWKAALVLSVIGLVEIIYVCANVHNDSALIAVLWNLLKLAACVWIVLMLRRLHDGARIIADGDLTHRVEEKNMYGDLKTHAEYLNRIGDGLSRSVDNQLRAERMKTELITNVSHDLKTPLTSIVNYVDLLKKEELTGTAGEYVEVLERQSARLKKLTEDLVEASKASSGALQVTTERVNLQELMEQVQAEYGSRLEEAMLTPIVRVPEGKAEVWADGKYVWRILDNLLGNVCKYAMPGTRVYLELSVQENTATFSVKNMSRDSLNITAEELVERFVRGDSSRNTEGSGLGLSIAQSLAALMGGEVKITIDGDLFKADVILPAAK